MLVFMWLRPWINRKEAALQRISQAGLSYYRHESWAGLAHGIFTRRGGVSESHWTSLNVGGVNGDDAEAVRENHRRMYRAVDVNPERAATTWLVHGVRTIVVEGPAKGRGWLAKADGMITNQPDTPLVMRFADCVPLLLYDPAKRAIGLGHAGWRGAIQGMAASLVKKMQCAYNSRSEDIEAVIGPAISQPNYPVGDDVAAAVRAYYGQAPGLISQHPAGRAHLNLWKANQLDFERQGVRKVTVLEICTFENTNDFFSHRGEQGKTGRFGVVMSL